jgi:hypothetical protein
LCAAFGQDYYVVPSMGKFEFADFGELTNQQIADVLATVAHALQGHSFTNVLGSLWRLANDASAGDAANAAASAAAATAAAAAVGGSGGGSAGAGVSGVGRSSVGGGGSGGAAPLLCTSGSCSASVVADPAQPAEQLVFVRVDDAIRGGRKEKEAKGGLSQLESTVVLLDKINNLLPPPARR